jgi:predicted N-formylglutamate amidohydrolase
MGDASMPRGDADLVVPVRTVNAAGQGAFVIAVDHASNRIPPAWSDLGLSPAERVRHIAWDPGALAVSLRLSEQLDAPLVHSTVSRLVIDCNRDTDAPDLIPTISETTAIPGNAAVTPEDRARRIAFAHAPFHAALDRLLDDRARQGRQTILICLHSFTPVFKGRARPWPIGIIHARNGAYTAALRAALADAAPGLNVGWNEPYSALNGVTFTLEQHGDGRGLDATMIEIRNDEILEPSGVARWADRLARCLEQARVALGAAPAHSGAAIGELNG